MTINTSNLPETARALVEHLGPTLALKIIQTWPGLKFRIPQGVREDAPLRDKLRRTFGDDEAQLVMDHFGGETLYVPTCAQAVRDLRDLRIIEDYGQGVTVDELALREHLSARQIENILKRTPGDGPTILRRAKPVNEDQLDLFETGPPA